MMLAVKHWKGRDSKFLLLAIFNLSLILIYLAHAAGGLESSGHTWRRIDLQALRQELDKGNLSAHEAHWYHRSTPDEISAPRQTGTP